MMFMPNSDRQINLSSSDYRSPASIINSLGYSPNYNLNFNPLGAGVSTGSPNINTVNNMMDNFNNFWSHTVPTNMPWAQSQIQSNPANMNPLSTQPFVMRFTAGPSVFNEICAPDPCTSQTATEWELLNKLSSGTGTCTSNLHLKRRNSSDDDDEIIGQPPTKQYISEDKVTAKFNQMSISNSEPASPSSPTKVEEDDELETEYEVSNKSTIVLSNEIKEALSARNDRIERLFQDELNKATKSVVLWQPPIGLLPPPLNVYKKDEEEEKEKTEKIITPKQNYEPLEVDVDVVDTCIMDSNEMMDL